MDNVSARIDLNAVPLSLQSAERSSHIWAFFWAGLSLFVALLGLTLAHVLPVAPRVVERPVPRDTHITAELHEQRLALEALRQEIVWMAAQRAAPIRVIHVSATQDAQSVE